MALIKVVYSFGGTGKLWRFINCSYVKILPNSSNTDRIQFKLLLNHLGKKRLISNSYISIIPKESFVGGETMDKTQFPQKKTLLMEVR